jgi:dTDP-4-dehydrorhamnose reductase
MRVLVTGREGQLVQSLVERSRGRSGVEIVAMGRPELDLELPRTLRSALLATRPDLVVNAAAYTAVDQAEDEPDRAFRVNADAAAELAAAASEAGAGFVQISTDYVFDGSAQGPYSETAPVRPLGVYGRSKLLGEQQVRDAHPGATIVRTSWVYSPYGRNFVKTMLSLAESRNELSVVADQHGCPSSALDLADGLLALVAARAGGGASGAGETYHLAGTGTANWAELAASIFEEAAARGLPSAAVRPISTAEWPTRAERPRNSVLDSSKFDRDFGYRAPHWRASVAEVVERLAAR